MDTIAHAIKYLSETGTNVFITALVTKNMIGLYIAYKVARALLPDSGDKVVDKLYSAITGPFRRGK